MGIWRALELEMDCQRSITLVGGGGKTTLMYALARQALLAGKRVIVTTTTHILPQPGCLLTEQADPIRLRPLLERNGVVMLGRMGPDGRVQGVQRLEQAAQAAQITLIEGDGARLLPLKAPADHEPVIPPWSGAVVAVAGLDCLFQPIRQACHRPERVCALLGKGPEERIEPADVAALLASPLAGRKGVKAGMAFRCALNKADIPGAGWAAREIVDRLGRVGILATVTTFPPQARGGALF